MWEWGQLQPSCCQPEEEASAQGRAEGAGSLRPWAWSCPPLELLGRFSSCLNCSALEFSLPCRGKHSLISNADNNNQQQHMRKTDEIFYFSMTDFQRGSTSELFYQSTHKRDNEVLITHLKLPYSKFMWAALVFSFPWALYFSRMCWRIRWINTIYVPRSEAYVYFCHLDKAAVI